MLQFVESQRAGHDLATEQQQSDNYLHSLFLLLHPSLLLKHFTFFMGVGLSVFIIGIFT